MMETLVHHQKLVLFGQIDEISPSQMEPVLDLLHQQYSTEAVGYPNQAPTFSIAAASWSASILFHAAQLLLYRSHNLSDLHDFFPPFNEEKSAGGILSADLSLRYLPSILRELRNIDVDDALIPILENILQEWHYSGLLSQVDLEGISFGIAYKNNCLKQLYVDRVIARKQLKVAQLPAIKGAVISALGDYQPLLWKAFNENL